MNCVTIAGHDVYFPFQPYSIQKAYMARLLDCLRNNKNGLLESPTGTGKTLSILCAAMAWMDAENEKWADTTSNNGEEANGDVALINGAKPEDRVRVIYASRTHVQLSQAMKELKNSYYSTRSAIILGSRDQLCVNPDVSRLESNAAKTHACRTKTRTGGCSFYDGYEPKVLTEYESLDVVDIEDLVTKGVSKKFCPYFASRLLKQKADVIFSPYNYLLDPALRRIQGIDLKNCVVIFDEGHNIEQNCEDCASSELRSLTLEVCIKEIDVQLNKTNNPRTDFQKGGIITSDALLTASLQNEPEAEMADLSPVDLLNAKTLLQRLQTAIEEQLVKTNAAAERSTDPHKNVPKVPVNWLFDLLSSDLRLNRDSVERLLAIFDKMSLSLGGTSTHAINRLKIASFDAMATFFRAIFPPDLTTAQLIQFQNEFRRKFAITLEEEKDFKKFQEQRDAHSISSNSTAKMWKMNLYCLSPSVAMSQMMELGVKCVIITSGTLSPLDSFESEMEIPFPVKLENKHVIEDKQVTVVAVDGKNDCKFDSRYSNRENNQYPMALGEALIEYSRIIPGGILVFFSSYAVLRNTTEMWERRRLWDRLGDQKVCFKEPQDKFGFAECLEKYKEQVDSKRGAIFFGVCRGKLSEGLDIGNDYCRAVILIGIPYPAYYDHKAVLKREYIDAKKNPKFSSRIFYEVQMKRSLNQAIGRIIRHKDDFGAVLLLDFRFAEHSQSLSKWLRPYFKKSDFAESKRHLTSFFAENGHKATACKPQRIAITASNDLMKPFTPPLISNDSRKNYTIVSKSTIETKSDNYFSIFNSATRNSGLTGPERKQVNSRPSPYSRPNNSTASSPKDSPRSASQSLSKDLAQQHGEIRTYLRKMGKLDFMTIALEHYKQTNNLESLAEKIIPLFETADAATRQRLLTSFSRVIKGHHRQAFLSLSGIST